MRLRARFGSIEARLGLTLALVAVLVFVVVGLLLHTVLEQVLISDEKADLQGKIQVVQRFVDEVRSDADLLFPRSEYACSLPDCKSLRRSSPRGRRGN